MLLFLSLQLFDLGLKRLFAALEFLSVSHGKLVRFPPRTEFGFCPLDLGSLICFGLTERLDFAI